MISLLLAILILFPLYFSTNQAQGDIVVVLANSIDFSLGEDFISSLEAMGYRVIHSTAAEFDNFKEQPVIVILGGHKAPEGVGPIVDRLLPEDVKQFLETRGNYGLFLVFNPYVQGQVIWILAGNDRNLTRTSHQTYGELVGPTPFPEPEINLFMPEESIVGGLVFFEASDLGGSLLPIAKIEYLEGDSWLLIGEDDGLDPDYDVERSTRTIMWDTYGMQAGWYTLRITFYDLIGQVSELIFKIYVDPPPISVINVVSFDPETGYVVFDASESYDPNGQITEWIWEFGDGEIGEGPVVEHQYGLENLSLPLIVSLTLTDDMGIKERKEYVFSNGTVREEFVPQVKGVREEFDNIHGVFNYLDALSKEQQGEVKDLLKNASLGILSAEFWLTHSLTELAVLRNVTRAIEDIEDAKKEIKKVIDALNDAKEKAATKDLKDKIQKQIDKLHEVWVRLQFIVGKLKVVQMIGPKAHGAEIEIPEIRIGNGSYYTWCTKKITLLRSDVWDTDVILHELDHYLWHGKAKKQLSGGGHWVDEHLVDRKYKEYLKLAENQLKAKGLPPNVPAPLRQKLRKLAEERGRALALSEGWADFSQAAKQGDPDYWDKEPKDNDDIRFDIEKMKIWQEKSNKWEDAKNKGEDVELSVAGILWDLFDGKANGTKDQDNDGVSIDFKYIWCAINYKKDSNGRVIREAPKNIREFYKNLIECLKEAGVAFDKNKIEAVFKAHGVTP